MEGFNLRCNNLRCRRVLDTRAVVTTCSHVFCETCTECLHLTDPRQGRSRHCPACQSALSDPDDVVIMNLSPPEDYRTSLLSGLSPSVIMDICQRGLSFWNYQVIQEVVYQETIAKGLADKCIALSNDLDKVINDANVEILRLQQKVTALKISTEDLKKKNHDVIEKWREKGRKLAQTQDLYDKLKRRTLMTQVGLGAVENLERAFGHGNHHNTHGLTGVDVGGYSIQQNHQPTLARQKLATEPDFMTGSRIGTINGSGLPQSASDVSGRRSPTPRYYSNGQVVYSAGAHSSAFLGQENTAATPTSQEHRQRLLSRPVMNRNPLGPMNGNNISCRR